MRVASILLFCAVVSLASCHKNPVGTTKKPTELSDKGRRMDNLTYLFFCMKGNYSSEDQSRNDSDYYNIRLRMVPVWKKENDVFYQYDSRISAHRYMV